MILLFLTTLAMGLAWIATPLVILSYYGIVQINPPANLPIVIIYLILLPFISYVFLDTFRSEYQEAKKKGAKTCLLILFGLEL